MTNMTSLLTDPFTKQYDFLNRLAQVVSLAGPGTSGGGVPLSSFAYRYNQATQRTQVTNTDNSYWIYQYDNLGQLISGKNYWADGTPVAGQQFTYRFDDVGNRQSTGTGGDVFGNNLRNANYAANNLNQSVSCDVPGYAEILGSATPNATVTVNLQRAVRQGGYFWDELRVSNTTSAVYLSLTNLAVLHNGTNADILTTNVGRLFLPETPEFFACDADGNSTNSGRWMITWDAENRPVSFASIPSSPLTSQRKVDCAYDFLGRRVQKIVSTNNGTIWIAISTNRYVYDGWNLVAVLDFQSSVIQSFTWGKDLSGSMQGAGGVGGLLAMTVNTGSNAGTYDCSYDGNGNVVALVNAVNGSVAGQWEYGPFGNLLRASGAMGAINPFLFSTKFFDMETEFSCYGHRFYQAGIGKWASRDPLEEQGGVNLYGFVGNDPINRIDALGLFDTTAPVVNWAAAEEAALGGEEAAVGVAEGLGGVAAQEAELVGLSSVSASASLGAAGGVGGTMMAATTALTDVAILMSVALQAEVNAWQAATGRALTDFQATAKAVQAGTQTYAPYNRGRLPKGQPYEDPCTDCLYFWSHVDLSNFKEHTDYVNEKFPTANIGVTVIAPDNIGANFDAGVPSPFPDIVYELKTRRLWADRPLAELSSGNLATLTKDTLQFGRESHVASACLLNFNIWFKERWASLGYKDKLPGFAPIMSWKP